MPGNRPCRRALCSALVLCAASVICSHADDTVINSKHDLSSAGPGPARALEESQVCIFCHTPHNASPAAPLWNRSNPVTYYQIYSSPTLQARIGQPTGSSKLCLSCHDGSIALGMVLSRETPIPMTHTIIPAGSDLTNDLSDDHPIGFRYDRQLSNRDPQIRSPDLIDKRIELGPRGELECIACHDPHNNELGDFLRLPVDQGVLCNTCHQMDGWRLSAHATSPRAVPPQLTLGEHFAPSSMAERACTACHVSHGAEHPEYLLRENYYQLCVSCHNGLHGRDVLSVMGQLSGHQPKGLTERHSPDEDPRTMKAHVQCVDCHNPHAAQRDVLSQAAQFPGKDNPAYMPTMEFVPGVSLAGVPIADARFYYEVCFRCHGDNPVPIRGRIPRQVDNTGNIRRQLAPSAASAHPITVISAGRNSDAPSLIPQMRGAVTIGCQDCHNNPDARQLGGGGPNGPHGSRYPFLLVDEYETADYTSESPQAYALCYQCHDRNSILADESFSLHQIHVVRGRSPCSACHAPHGVSGSPSRHSNLINFDVSIVGGQRLYEDTGTLSGSCTLVCHGVDHVRFGYSR